MLHLYTVCTAWGIRFDAGGELSGGSVPSHRVRDADTDVTVYLLTLVFFCPQYLFLAFPRIIFLLGFVMVLSLLLAGYLCFVLYLVATNQTTNEWYRGDWAWRQHCPLVAWAPSATPHVYQNFHSHGVWSNLQEVFLLATPCAEKKRN